ncbi:MAG: MerR family transcriptional regulator [Planctomycetota bacterium]|jgi:MerR family transcriptional regulator/heat shock protein HspR
MSPGAIEYDIEDPLISIGTLAKKVGLSVSTVRHYESEGLIIPHRDESGRRLFSLEDVTRVQNIQHLIQDLGLNIEGIRRIQALLPCWDLFHCKKKTRDKCPAFLKRAKPCWTIKGLACSPQGNECRKCIVYRFGSQCTEDIKRLLYDQYHSPDAGTAIMELMQRKRKQ